MISRKYVREIICSFQNYRNEWLQIPFISFSFFHSSLIAKGKKNTIEKGQGAHTRCFFVLFFSIQLLRWKTFSIVSSRWYHSSCLWIIIPYKWCSIIFLDTEISPLTVSASLNSSTFHQGMLICIKTFSIIDKDKRNCFIFPLNSNDKSFRVRYLPCTFYNIAAICAWRAELTRLAVRGVLLIVSIYFFISLEICTFSDCSFFFLNLLLSVLLHC